jgi:hypothetical protein
VRGLFAAWDLVEVDCGHEVSLNYFSGEESRKVDSAREMVVGDVETVRLSFCVIATFIFLLSDREAVLLSSMEYDDTASKEEVGGILELLERLAVASKALLVGFERFLPSEEQRVYLWTA